MVVGVFLVVVVVGVLVWYFVCFADGLPWVVGPGSLEYLDVWTVGLPSDVGGGAVAGCREAVVSGAVYVVRLVTARGAEASVVFTAN